MQRYSLVSSITASCPIVQRSLEDCDHTIVQSFPGAEPDAHMYEKATVKARLRQHFSWRKAMSILLATSCTLG
jgi:hypothetical protein